MDIQTTFKIFILDDDKIIAQVIEKHLMYLNTEKKYLPLKFQISSFNKSRDLLKSLNQKPDVLILDYYLTSIDKNEENGLEILKKVKNTLPYIKVIMLSGQSEVITTAEIMKAGAYDYIVKDNSFIMRLDGIISKLVNDHKKKDVMDKRNMVKYLILILVLIIIACILIS